MIKIIKRKDRQLQQKEQLWGKPQVSFNDYGHLVFRCIESDGKDNLVVFSQEATNRIVDFVNRYLSNKNQTILHVNNLNIEKINDIPF